MPEVIIYLTRVTLGAKRVEAWTEEAEEKIGDDISNSSHVKKETSKGL